MVGLISWNFVGVLEWNNLVLVVWLCLIVVFFLGEFVYWNILVVFIFWVLVFLEVCVCDLELEFCDFFVFLVYE